MDPTARDVVAQKIVSRLTLEQVLNSLENLAADEAAGAIDGEEAGHLRGLLLKKLDSYRRGRRGLMSVPELV